MKNTKTYRLELDALDALFEKLEERYDIYAPVRVPAGGRYAQQDSVLYRQVHRYDEIEFHERSTYPMKEVLMPITQTLFYFTENEYRESKCPQKDLLLFGRVCDINAIKIQDQIYLQNGGIEDPFYKRVRNKVKFALIECKEQFEGCFCCSVGANVTDLHSLAFSCGDNRAHIELLDEAFEGYFDHAEPSDYRIQFPQENELKVKYPVIDSIDLANKLKDHPMWKEFDDRCIACGSCTVACSTCTCFETVDLVYTQNAHVGERRRTCSSCMVDGFDEMAGGQCFRKTTAEKYRYKILHKVYGHNARFHTGPMCVGCGRCSARCPELISYPATLNKLTKAIKEIKREEEMQHA
ncbi:anaerobic sulfite reductase subunit AsrA [Mahella sp.]|uniref:anaerobic sulfite reductase subunit AsrA n=1 Tax=Mahella sp. TaxID=2798721 RepID=UPI0025BCDB7C|nr:anaerobic sulfite reductase subunit AsrA [Mahella sp.]MBZ4665798.1 asrA [Mahella sp.]